MTLAEHKEYVKGKFLHSKYEDRRQIRNPVEDQVEKLQQGINNIHPLDVPGNDYYFIQTMNFH